jgi:hypothetical protein
MAPPRLETMTYCPTAQLPAKPMMMLTSPTIETKKNTMIVSVDIGEKDTDLVLAIIQMTMIVIIELNIIRNENIDERKITIAHLTMTIPCNSEKEGGTERKRAGNDANRKLSATNTTAVGQGMRGVVPIVDMSLVAITCETEKLKRAFHPKKQTRSRCQLPSPSRKRNYSKGRNLQSKS